MGPNKCFAPIFGYRFWPLVDKRWGKPVLTCRLVGINFSVAPLAKHFATGTAMIMGSKHR